MPGVNVHRAEFRAAVQGRDVLAGVEQALRVERRFYRVKQGQLVAVELRAHLIDFLPSHAVFAGDAAADLHAQFQYLPAQRFRPGQFAGLVGVEQDQRMHIAVAGMEHIGHAQAMFGAEAGDAFEHAGQFAAGMVPSMQ